MQPASRSSTPTLLYTLLAIILTIILIFAMRGCITGAKKSPPPAPTEIALLTQAAPTGGVNAAGPTVMTATAPRTGSVATPVSTAEGCPAPTGWIQHSVRQDETLYYLATSTGASVEAVMKANCLDSDLIQVGQHLFLPSIPPVRPTFPPPPPQPARGLDALPGLTKLPPNNEPAMVPSEPAQEPPLLTITQEVFPGLTKLPPNNEPGTAPGTLPGVTKIPPIGLPSVSPYGSSPLFNLICLGVAIAILFVMILFGFFLYIRRKVNPGTPNHKPE